jgi:hypothetical protein
MRYLYVLFALAAVSLFAATSPGPPVEDPKPANPPVTFRSDVSLVLLDAQVVDLENRAITGLRVEDFILREGESGWRFVISSMKRLRWM